MNIGKNLSQLPHLQRIALALLALYSCAVVSYGIAGAVRSSGDQQNFHVTSQLLLDRIDPFRMTVDFLQSTRENIRFSDIDRHGGRSMYPPSTHLLLIPFYGFLISPVLSKYCWLVCNIISLGIIYYALSVRYLANSAFLHRAVLLCVIIGAASTKTNLSLGQTALFSYAAFLLTLLLKKRNPWLSGVAFALAVSKPSLMVLFTMYLLCKKEYRTVLTACAIHLALTGIISAWLGTSPLTLINNYLMKVSLLSFYKGTISFYYQTNGISFKSLLFTLNAPHHIITAATIGLYVSAITFIVLIKNHTEHFALGVTAMLTLLVDYHQHYDFIILLCMLPGFVDRIQHKKQPVWPLAYFLLLLYVPNMSRINFFGYSTATAYQYQPAYLCMWQFFYTGLYVVLLIVYLQTASRTQARPV